MGVVAEIVLVALFEALGWYATRALETRAVAASLWLILTATGAGAGIAWGAYAGSSDFIDTPVSPWIALAVGIVAVVLAVRAPTGDDPARTLKARLFLFATFNAAIVIGVAVGYNAATS